MTAKMQLPKILCLSIIGFAIGHTDAAVDPCLKENHKSLSNLGSRNEQCVPDNLELNALLCDIYLPTDWYITGNAVMLNHEPKTGRCGVDTPLWLIDQFPKYSDGIMDRDVCVWASDDACNETVSIQIKNCSSFYVYKLQQLPGDLGCPAAYCFVSNEPCVETKHLTTKATIQPIPGKDEQDKKNEKPTDLDSSEDRRSHQTTTALIAGLIASVIFIGMLSVVIAVLVVRNKRPSCVKDVSELYAEPLSVRQGSPPPMYTSTTSLNIGNVESIPNKNHKKK